MERSQLRIRIYISSFIFRARTGFPSTIHLTRLSSTRATRAISPTVIVCTKVSSGTHEREREPAAQDPDESISRLVVQ